LHLLGIGFAALTALAGCYKHPPRVPVPAPGESAPLRDHDPVKPLPGHADRGPDNAPGFNDAPLVNQRPPEQRAFVNAYNRVGRPRIAVFVNRTLQGEIVPVNQEGDVITAFDYETVENVLTDWLASNGQVTILSPVTARQRLTPEQIRGLESEPRRAITDLPQQLGVDVLVLAQARPTQQSFDGLHVRLVAEAINVTGGDSIARASVDIKPPLDKPQVNTYTRYVARKLMDDMTGAWSSGPAPAVAPGPSTTAPR
jgi:hypothetical protein